MFVRIFTTVNQFPKTILLVVLALSAFFFVQARDGLFDSQTGKLRINSTVEPFIERDSGAYQEFLDARKAFGSEEVVVIAMHNTERKPIGLEFLLKLGHLKSDIETTVPDITKVMSMLDIPQASGECAGKSYFHQMGIGSVCFSVLEKYEQDISCLNSTASSSTPDSEGNLEESLLEEGLEESQESNLEESLEENLEASPEENTGDTVGIQSEAETLEETAPDCSLFNSGKSPEQLRNDAEDAVSKIVSSLKGHPLFEGDVLSHNLSTAALIISFSTGSKPESDNTQTILKGLLSKYQKDSEIAETLRIAYAGQPRQINKASHLIRQDMALILPLSLMLIVLVLLIAFRSIRAVIVPMLVVIFGILWTAGIIGFIGDELNLVTMACAPIIVCVGSAYVIKFLNQFQIESLQIHEAKKSGESQPTISEVVFATVSSVSIPVTVTAITTVAGFIALVVSPIPAVQQLGLYTSVGIVFINLFTLTLAPALLHYIRLPDLAPTENNSGLLDRFFQVIVEWLRLYSKRLIWIWMIVASIVALGMLQLSINSSSKSFPEESQLVKDLQLIEDELSGTDTLRLLFKARNESENQQDSSYNPLKTA